MTKERVLEGAPSGVYTINSSPSSLEDIEVLIAKNNRIDYLEADNHKLEMINKAQNLAIDRLNGRINTKDEEISYLKIIVNRLNSVISAYEEEYGS